MNTTTSAINTSHSAIDETAARLAEEFTGLGVDADWVLTVSKICDGKYLLARALLLQQLPQKSRDEYVQHKVSMMSVIQPYTTASNECGYCHRKKGSVTYGMNAQRLTVEDYQMLIDRGWRRSGRWLYQPQNSVTCCPQHTIRLDVAQFTPSRAHKQLRRRLARYLKGEILPNNSNTKDDENNVNMTDVTPPPNKEKKNFESELQQLTAPVTAALAQTLAKCGYHNVTPHVTVNDRCHWPSRGHLTSHVSLQLAGRELKEQTDKAKNNTAKNSTDSQQKKTKNSKTQSPVTARAKEIAARLIAEAGESRDWTMSVADSGHVLIRITNTDLEQQLALFVDAHRKPVTCPAANNSNKMETEPKHKLKITLHRAAYSDEAYRLFKKYQMTVHHEAEDEVSRDGYERFLVKGPLYNGNDQHGVVLNRKELPEELQGLVEVDTCQFVPYGAYHQHYRLDDKLIAVAVLDVLPKCLSSVYFYYDPDYSFLDLGVLSALFEIDWIKNHVTAPPANQNAFQHYYLGYYIHSCVKMRYKAQFRPSDLLCSDTRQWVAFDKALPILEKTPVSQYRLADESASSVHVTDEMIEAAFDELMLQISAHVIFMEELRPESQETVRSVLTEFIAHVGPDLASRFVCRLR